MHVLLAPDAFGGTLGAVQVAEAMAVGWGIGAAHDQVEQLPLSDGGPGFLDVIERAVGGTVVASTVSDPLGREVPATVLVVEDEGLRTAYVEGAQAHGLHLLAADERHPGVTSTWGIGQLVEVALDQDVRRIVIGVGGGATNDAGAGLLGALGAGPPEVLARGGLALANAPEDPLPGLLDVRARLAGVDLLLATDEETSLLGLKGTSALEAPGKGALPTVAQDLEGALGHFVDVTLRGSGAPTLDLLTGRPRRLDREAGAGASGGLGFGLLLLGARQISAVDEVLRVTRFADRARAADLVVTGAGRVDWASLRGSVIAAVATATLATGRPTVLVAGECLVGRRETMGLGIASVYAVAETEAEVEAMVANPVDTVATRTARVARTWSPAR